MTTVCASASKWPTIAPALPRRRYAYAPAADAATATTITTNASVACAAATDRIYRLDIGFRAKALGRGSDTHKGSAPVAADCRQCRRRAPFEGMPSLPVVTRALAEAARSAADGELALLVRDASLPEVSTRWCSPDSMHRPAR